MSVISLIKLIIIVAGMFFYYRLMDENNGYYISIPVIGGFIVLLLLGFTLDPVATVIFYFIFRIFLYFVFIFMAQIDTIIALTYLVLNLLSLFGNSIGFFGPSVPLIVFVVSTAGFMALRFFDIEFAIVVVKWGILSEILLIGFEVARVYFLAHILVNFKFLPIS